jgi:hypothetical protein
LLVLTETAAVKIYVAAMEALRKKERQDETQFSTKLGKRKDRMKLSFPPKLEKGKTG